MKPICNRILVLAFSSVLGFWRPTAFATDAPLAARWDFGSEEALPLTPRGDLVRDQPGPRPPEFPNLEPENMAVQLKGNGARFEIKDPGPQSRFDFTNGDTITLEAWILVEALRPGQPAYLIGKGRTLSPRFGKDNQNWSLRVVGAPGGQAQLSFLFTSTAGASVFHWHRWTSDAAFRLATGWHHVALTYEFGKPGSILGWIDGVATNGTWDVDGPTSDPPVVDDDDVWIGSSQNDSPFAAKGHIIASAFLGIELQCARCHDSPYHSTTQRDLYSLAAMLSRKTVTVPATSRVPAGFFENKGRESLIKVTLKPDEPVMPAWPFAATTGAADGTVIDELMENPQDPRERFAALVTAPQNRRFARVFVNRTWKRLMGAGFVEPAHDWEGREVSHPGLLDWLAAEFVSHDYDLKHLLRLITTSAAYQREAASASVPLAAQPAAERFFNAPGRRRLTAEQIVDSLHAASGKAIDSEELTFVHDGRHPLERRQTLGVPRRAWMFASLNNERDRPSLALPHAQTTVDVLEAFGWNGSRQMPVFERPTDPNLLQPGILANGTLVQALSRASNDSDLAKLAVP